jgi:hypothetical protein
MKLLTSTHKYLKSKRNYINKFSKMTAAQIITV